MGEPQSESAVDRGEGEKNPIAFLFSNFIEAIKRFFPPKKTDTAIDPSRASDEVKNAGIVTFPKRSFVPVKLGVEAEDAERSTNPILLWQVYAIGGAFVLRWAWTRWNERKGLKKPDDEPSPPID